jgi:hypothetical protein
MHKQGAIVMDGSGSHTKVWRNGRLQDADGDAALAALCQAVERAVRAHQSEGNPVRAVILMIDQPVVRAAAPDQPETGVAPVPVYVDVFDSGFGQDSGYGHGI